MNDFNKKLRYLFLTVTVKEKVSFDRMTPRDYLYKYCTLIYTILRVAHILYKHTVCVHSKKHQNKQHKVDISTNKKQSRRN